MLNNMKKENSGLGEGLGCAFMIIAAGIFISMPAIVEIIKILVSCKK